MIENTDYPALWDWESKSFKHEIHMSHVNNYLRCPKQFEAKYIKKQADNDSNYNLSFGRVNHHFLNEQVKRKLEKKEMLQGDEIADYISDQIEEQAEFLEGEEQTKFRQDKDYLISGATALQEDYIANLIPRRTEQKFSITIPDSPYKLVGTTDIERKLNPDEKIFPNRRFGVDDLKTAGSSPSKEKSTGAYKPKTEHFLQQTAYTFASWIANKLDPKDYKQTINRTIYLVKNKKPVIRPASFVVTSEHISFLHSVLEQMVKGLGAGVLNPNPNGWWCTKDFCPIFTQCRKSDILTVEQFKQSNETAIDYV
jgi:hypothetical protein